MSTFLLHQFAERRAVAIDAERVRQGQRHLLSGRMRGSRGAKERALRGGGVEQVTFEVGHGSIRHEGLGHIGFVEADAGAEIGVHRALSVRRDHDQAARGGGATGSGVEGKCTPIAVMSWRNTVPS